MKKNQHGLSTIKKALMILLMIAFLGQGGYIVHKEMAKPAIVEVSNNLCIINGVAHITMSSRMIHFKDVGPFKRDLEYIKTVGIKKLHIDICSPGGVMHAGTALYDALKAVKVAGLEISTHALGYVASAAIPIFLLGDVRTMGDNAWLMLHPHNGVLSEYNSDTENEMLKFWTDWWATIIANRTDMSKVEVLKIVAGPIGKASMVFMNKTEALKLGFITE